MKQVHVRRHAPKHATGSLTEEGKKLAQELKKQLNLFELVISSDKARAVETAILLTGITPILDPRAGTPPFTPQQEKELHEKGKTHMFGIAGVILENPDYRVMIQQKGESLNELIQETLNKLPDNGTALIISHDGVMVAAEQLFKKISLDKAKKTFKPLQGFVIDDQGNISDLE